MGNRRYVTLSELNIGMRIDQSIIDSTGRVLVARGALLEGFHIEGLRNLNINGVYITDADEYMLLEGDVTVSSNAERMIDTLSVVDVPTMLLSENVKKQVLEGMQFLYNNPHSENFVRATNSITDELMHAIVENDAVAVNISNLKVTDEYTFKHSVDVASMAMIIAKRLGLSAGAVREVGMAGLLHDLGKSQIPSEILNKPGRLTDEEFAIMKRHSMLGYELIKEKEGLSKAIHMGVLQHHEKINGKGYPLGLSASGISLVGRILSVADIYDALVTERPYKSAFSPRDAVEMILAMSQELDNGIIKSFMETVVLYPVGTTVQLSNNEYARVVENVYGQPMRPKVVELSTGKVYDLANDSSCANLIIP